MDQHGNHPMRVDVECEVVCRIMRVAKNQMANMNHRMKCRYVSDIVRGQYAQSQVIQYLQPFAIDSENYLNIVLIRSADEDDTIWADIPNIRLLRRNWGMIFINTTPGLRVRVYPEVGNEEGVKHRTWTDPSTGLVHAQKFVFYELMKED